MCVLQSINGPGQSSNDCGCHSRCRELVDAPGSQRCGDCGNRFVVAVDCCRCQFGILGHDAQPGTQSLFDVWGEGVEKRLDSGGDCAKRCFLGWALFDGFRDRRIKRILKNQRLLGGEMAEKRHLAYLGNGCDLCGSGGGISLVSKEFQGDQLYMRVGPIPFR